MEADCEKKNTTVKNLCSVVKGVGGEKELQ